MIYTGSKLRTATDFNRSSILAWTMQNRKFSFTWVIHLSTTTSDMRALHSDGEPEDAVHDYQLAFYTLNILTTNVRCDSTL